MGETPRARSAIGKGEPMQRIVGKNSSRPASVEFSRHWRENYARSRVQFLQTRAQRSGLRLSVCQIFFDTRNKATAAERWGGFVFLL